MAVDERNLHVLHDGDHDALDRLLGLVLDVHVEADLLVVVEELPVQRQLKIQLAAGESEALGDHRARLLGAGRQRGVLHLMDQRANWISYLLELGPIIRFLVVSCRKIYIPCGWPWRRRNACGSDPRRSLRQKSGNRIRHRRAAQCRPACRRPAGRWKPERLSAVGRRKRELAVQVSSKGDPVVHFIHPSY